MLAILITIFIAITIITVYRQERFIDKCKSLLDRQAKEIEIYQKTIDKMAEHLTTDYHTKEWVIAHYMGEIK